MWTRSLETVLVMTTGNVIGTKDAEENDNVLDIKEFTSESAPRASEEAGMGQRGGV